MRYVVLVLVASLIAGCGDTTPRAVHIEDATDGAIKRPTYTQDQINRWGEARVALDQIQAELDAAHAVSPAQRWALEETLEPRLVALVDKARDTPEENRAVYFLAQWRIVNRDGEGAAELLKRLAGLPQPKFKEYGRYALVQCYLLQGNLTQAKTLALDLVENTPEFSPLLQLIAYYEQVGSPAPSVSTQSLSGGPENPLTRHEPWLVYLFFEVMDEQAWFTIHRYADALKDLPSDNYRIVAVTRDSSPLGPTTRLSIAPERAHLDLLWLSPSNHTAQAQWEKAWRLSHKPPAMLIGPGPQRLLMLAGASPRAVAKNLGLLRTTPTPAAKPQSTP